MMPTSKFIHQPLDNTTKQVRFLQITRIYGSKIHCSINHFDLDSAPPYRALSYTWGPADVCKEIYIDGYILNIRQNLFDFLMVYGENQTEKLLWVDQICIDQTSVLERNHQVSIMAEIYSMASEVIIWLGHAKAEVADVVLPFFQGENSYKLVMDKFYRPPDFGSGKYEPRTGLLSQVEPSFQQFFNNPYWSRLWVIQEIMLAEHITIWWGDHHILWQDFSEFDRGYPNLIYRALIPRHLFRRIRYITKYRNTLAAENDFAEVVSVFSANQCEEPRDKVYGLLAVTRRYSREQITIDYGKNVEEVFVDAVRLIAKERDTYLWESTRINTCFDLAEAMLPEKFSRAKVYQKVEKDAMEEFEAILAWLAYDLGGHQRMNVSEEEYLVEKFRAKLL